MTTTPSAGSQPHADRTTASRRGSTSAIGLGVIAACAVVCSLPLLIAAGGAAGVGALLGGMEAVGIVLLAAAAGLAVWPTRRRRAHALPGGESCDCDTC